MSLPSLRCDGCGQIAVPGHITTRLQRLEWTTRYRPVHIGTLLLGAVSPLTDGEFLYSPNGEFAGEAALALKAAAILPAAKSAETVQTEFQRAGFFLTHVLECPFDSNQTNRSAASLIQERAPSVIARIRRSLKPKRVILISDSLASLAEHISKMELDCQVLLTS